MTLQKSSRCWSFADSQGYSLSFYEGVPPYMDMLGMRNLGILLQTRRYSGLEWDTAPLAWDQEQNWHLGESFDKYTTWLRNSELHTKLMLLFLHRFYCCSTCNVYKDVFFIMSQQPIGHYQSLFREVIPLDVFSTT